jgi:hypothetical protein
MPHGRVFRFPGGRFRNDTGRKILVSPPGFPDLAGVVATTRPCGSCGAPVTRNEFVGIEAKSRTGQALESQRRFHAMMEQLGFGANITTARTVAEAVAFIKRIGGEVP